MFFYIIKFDSYFTQECLNLQQVLLHNHYLQLLLYCVSFLHRSSAESNVSSVAITYSAPKFPEDKLELKCPYRFEVGCSSGTFPQKVEGMAKSVIENDVIVEFPMCGNGLKPMSICYCWQTDPCTFKMCPVYSSTNNPSPPFEMNLE